MKGTFFSADFVRDKDDNLRLIEINTDTGIVEDQKSVLDWTDFITILNNNNIDTVEVTYKASIQAPIIASLADALALHAPNVTTFSTTLMDEHNIFPNVGEDGPNKFILRMAYDELAVLDSEYAKGTLNLLKLFADNDSSESVIGFKHSSDTHGTYDTLDYSLSNPSNVPDFVTKTIEEEHTSHNFYKVGYSAESDTNRINGFSAQHPLSENIIQEYHYSPVAVSENNNKVSSIRCFQIVYGSDLDLCYVAEYEIPAIFELPEAIEFSDAELSNSISPKHYYEFATNHIKNLRHGFLGDTEILDADGNAVKIEDTVIGSNYKSYFINGVPDTDDIDLFESWNHESNSLPEGSFTTTSVLIDKYEKETYTAEMTLMTFKDGSEVTLGAETRLLVYDIVNNKICYKKVLDITPDKYQIAIADSTLEIEKVETIIFSEPQKAYALGLEEVDNFVLANGINGLSIGVFFLVAHNCFAAGTQIEMADGSFKKIEDVVEGDMVASLNEATHEIEPKVVSNPVQTLKDLIMNVYTMNGTMITSTLDHPYYTADLKLASRDGSTTEGNKLEVGNALYMRNGQAINIFEISEYSSFLERAHQTPMYIFTVADNHNFFANGLLVHNK